MKERCKLSNTLITQSAKQTDSIETLGQTGVNITLIPYLANSTILYEINLLWRVWVINLLHIVINLLVIVSVNHFLLHACSRLVDRKANCSFMHIL